MTIYLLMYIPYGAPSHDTDVLGVFATEELADRERQELIDKEYYPEDELFVLTRTVEGA